MVLFLKTLIIIKCKPLIRHFSTLIIDKIITVIFYLLLFERGKNEGTIVFCNRINGWRNHGYNTNVLFTSKQTK